MLAKGLRRKNYVFLDFPVPASKPDKMEGTKAGGSGADGDQDEGTDSHRFWHFSFSFTNVLSAAGNLEPGHLEKDKELDELKKYKEGMEYQKAKEAEAQEKLRLKNCEKHKE